MRDIMHDIGVTVSKRYTRSQKELFMKLLVPKLEETGVPIEVLTIENKTVKYPDLVVGNLKKADTVIFVGYDTPSKMLIPNYEFTPLDVKKIMKYEKLNRALLFLVPFLLIVVTTLLFSKANGNIMMYIGAVICGLISLLVFFKVAPGIANGFNFNRNSAGVAVVVKLIEEYNHSEKVAFVFSDNMAESYLGLFDFVNTIPKDKKIVVLDAIASGRDLVLFSANGSIEKLKQEFVFGDNETRYVNLHRVSDIFSSITNELIFICSGTLEKKKFVIENVRTKRDLVVDMKRLDVIFKQLLKYVNK